MGKLTPITGECFCGAIKYQVNGKLRDGKSCHCSRCRKAFNAQASAMAFVEPAEFEWLCGEDLLTSHIVDHGYGLQFCKICGSTLCTIYKNKTLQVSLGCVNGEPDIEIGQHIFVGSKANWEVIPQGVTQFEQWPPKNT
uniref:Aldehyde-activating protein n=1 Tax=OCS116 cluster bacterium TaxID=2030921 RepID=A0A2A4Z959_9PROT